MKTFLWNFNEIYGEMRRTSIQIFKHFDGNFVLFLRQFLEKLEKNCGEKYAIIGIDIDIDTFPSLSSYVGCRSRTYTDSGFCSGDGVLQFETEKYTYHINIFVKEPQLLPPAPSNLSQKFCNTEWSKNPQKLEMPNIHAIRCNISIWINEKHDNNNWSCATFPHATHLISFMKYISKNICFLFHSVRCSIEIYWFVASYKYFIFHATCFKQFVSLVCAVPHHPYAFTDTSGVDISILLICIGMHFEYRDIFRYFSENWIKNKLKEVEKRNVKSKKQRPKFHQNLKKLDKNIFQSFKFFVKFLQFFFLNYFKLFLIIRSVF